MKIKFKATTIKPKEFIGDTEKEIGAFSGNIYAMLNYLNNLGITIKKQALYRIKKPCEYLIEGNSQNNLVTDWCFNDILKRLKAERFPIHVKIEKVC